MTRGRRKPGPVIGFLTRSRAMVIKEFIQLRRDRMTFGIMIAVPLMQLILFGFAIDTNPRHLPTAVLAYDSGAHTRSFIRAMEATGYFDIVRRAERPDQLDRWILSGEILFAVEIPADFERKLARGERPQLLVIADATDPSAAGSAVAALRELPARALRRDLAGPISTLQPQPDPFELVIHRRYNPAGETSINIVPGLVGTILTLTMIIFTALAVTREIERGTMENLLSMPIRPVEVMLGKIVPYVFVGALQFGLILGAARLFFDVPLEGSFTLLIALTTLFIVANLSVGYTFSTVAQNQLQAMQMSMLFFLPSLLLSGFMFPFAGMPVWAQWIGEIFPLTHFLRIVRGIMLKGADFVDLAPEVGALGLFTLTAMSLAVARFRQTLD